LSYLDNSMCVIIRSWCRIHRITLGFFYINCRPCHIIWSYCCPYTGISIQFTVSPLVFAYLDNLMCVIFHSLRTIHRTSVGLVYINTGPCHFIWFCCCSYSSISNQYNVSPLIFDISRQYDVRYNPSLRLVYMNSRPCHIIWSYSCPYTGISIQFTVSPSLFHISRQFEVRYIPSIVSYTPHATRFCLYKHWSLSCYLTLLLFIYRYK
jgi:hypothetical protein